MKKELPKLPYGEGGFDWKNDKIRYRKTYTSKYDNKKHTATVVGETVRECLALMQQRIDSEEKRRKESLQHSMTNDSVVLEDAIKDWLSTFKINKNKASAYDREECTLKNQIASNDIGKIRTKDVSEKDIEELFNYLINEKKYSHSTVIKTYDLLNQFFRYYYRSDINNNPMNYVERPRPRRDIGEIDLSDDDSAIDADFVLSDSEITTFKKECYKKKSKYDIGIFFILLMCLRTGEACALLWRDIDTKNKTLKITKSLSNIRNREDDSKRKTKTILTSPKSKSSNRVIMMSDEAVKTILDYKNDCKYTEPTDYVFSTENRRSTGEQRLYFRVKSLIKSAKLNPDGKRDKFSPHDLRHTGISYYIRNGVPIDIVSKFAGHSSTAITARVYYHIIQEQKIAGLDLMNAIKRNTSAKNEKIADSVKNGDRT